MPHPLLIGGLVFGGALAAWRIARHERNRLRRIVGQLVTQQEARKRHGDEMPIPLERDPSTGIYRPTEKR